MNTFKIEVGNHKMVHSVTVTTYDTETRLGPRSHGTNPILSVYNCLNSINMNHIYASSLVFLFVTTALKHV